MLNSGRLFGDEVFVWFSWVMGCSLFRWSHWTSATMHKSRLYRN